jgi:four helix bundle protein
MAAVRSGDGQQFDHERLDVYRVAVEFVAWVGELLEGPLAGCHLSAVNQLDRASTSVPLNVAEGNGKRSPKDRSRFLDIARGSVFECSAALDVLIARRKLDRAHAVAGKALLVRLAGMLTKMTQQQLSELDQAQE